MTANFPVMNFLICSASFEMTNLCFENHENAWKSIMMWFCKQGNFDILHEELQDHNQFPKSSVIPE